MLIGRLNELPMLNYYISLWIKRTPNNMNRDGGAYHLSDIYEAIARPTTYSDQKIGGLFQSANQCLRKMSELDIKTVPGNTFLDVIRTF